MAKKRYVNTQFWRDSYVSNLDPSEKLLFLYLITNPDTNISGIYQVPLKIIAVDTGFDKEMIIKILARFERDGKIKYEDGWIALKNFIKNQNEGSLKVKIGIDSELKNVPDSLKNWVLNDKPYIAPVIPDRLTQRQSVLIRDDFTCSYCGKEITDNNDLQIDHILPIARGGKGGYENYTCSCAKCNNSKSDKTAIEYCGKDIKGLPYHSEQAFKKLKSNNNLIEKFMKMYPESTVLLNESTLSHLNLDLDLDSNLDLDIKPERKRFIPPSREEIQSFTNENQCHINIDTFIDYYNSNGWKIGKNKMLDWKATVRNWHRRDKENVKGKPAQRVDHQAIEDRLKEYER